MNERSHALAQEQVTVCSLGATASPKVSNWASRLEQLEALGSWRLR